jgi:MFS family permease
VSAAARYTAILRTPHVVPLLVSSMLARLPFGMFALALVLYIAEERGSFAIAGLVNGAFGVGTAISAPLQSRAIDRLGQARVLLPLAVVDAGATAVLVALTETGAPTAALMGCAFVGGISVPSLGAALRTLWPDLLRRRKELLATAFAIDSVAIEMIFTTGPLIAAVVIALVSPVAALAVSAGCMLTGVVLFVTRPPSRAWRPDPAAASHGALGALRSPGVRTLMLTTLPIGFGFGSVEISLPAFASEHGAAEWSGVLLSVWAAASAVGGLAYGARQFRAPLTSVYLWLAALLPLGFLPAIAAPSIPAMAVLILPAGLLIAPLGAALNQLVGEVAPAGARTEAYAWPVTMLLAGFAAGTTVGGALVEAIDWHACFVAASIAATLGAMLAYALRRTLAASAAIV